MKLYVTHAVCCIVTLKANIGLTKQTVSLMFYVYTTGKLSINLHVSYTRAVSAIFSMNNSIYHHGKHSIKYR